MASIRQRNGKWQARVRRKGRSPIEKTFTTRADAVKWARSVESEIDRGAFVDRSEAERWTFGEVLKRYQTEVTASKRGASIEGVRIKALCQSRLAGLRMASLTPKEVASWRDSRLKEVSGSTVNRELNVISAAIGVAIKEWGIALPSNPVALIRRPISNRPRQRRLTTAEEIALLLELKTTSRDETGRLSATARNPWVKPLVEFALETAMRRGELLALRWKDVDPQKRIAALHETKNGDSRKVPLSPKAIEVLTSLPRSIDGRVFPISQDALKKCFTRACARAGLSNFHLHDCRHEAVSRLFEQGFNVMEVATISGHKTLGMLKRYTHLRAEDLAKRLEETAA